MAVGNLDKDDACDAWTIGNARQLVNVSKDMN
jgi:hypothetical protein